MKKQKQRRDDTASIVAEIHGVSAAYVRMIINGKRENEAIRSTYRQLKQRKRLLIETVKNQFQHSQQ